jgi:flagella basal body P-ring formation protein FlgA
MAPLRIAPGMSFFRQKVPGRGPRPTTLPALRSFFFPMRTFLLTILIGGGPAVFAFTAESPALVLQAQAQVGGDGIFLSQLVATNAAPKTARIRIGEAPALGQTVVLTRQQLTDRLERLRQPLTNWAGADQVQITRRVRSLDELEVKEQLTAVLQRGYVRERGDLEIRLTRPWSSVTVPDENLTFKIVDVPTTGVTPYFIVRFEASAGEESLGTWQVAVQAKVWREIWVARSTVRRGRVLSDADITRERRDVLTLREAPLSLDELDARMEVAENLTAGSPLYERSVRLRPVMRRGQMVEAQVLDGAILISLKVELLEDGAPGQLVRVRNTQSKREFRGKVQDANTVLVSL